MTFNNLQEQITITKGVIFNKHINGKFLDSATELMLNNQLVLMEAINKLEDKIRSIPR